MSDSEADRLIALLALEPHPEGGHFRQTFRDTSGGGERGHSTLIYFLLKAGEVSRWHKVDAAEVWQTLRLFVGYKFGVRLPEERPNTC